MNFVKDCFETLSGFFLGMFIYVLIVLPILWVVEKISNAVKVRKRSYFVSYSHGDGKVSGHGNCTLDTNFKISDIEHIRSIQLDIEKTYPEAKNVIINNYKPIIGGGKH